MDVPATGLVAPGWRLFCEGGAAEEKEKRDNASPEDKRPRMQCHSALPFPAGTIGPALRSAKSPDLVELAEDAGGDRQVVWRIAGLLVRSGRSSRRQSATSDKAKPAEVPKKMNWKVSASAVRSPIAAVAEAVPCKTSVPSLAARMAPNTPTKVVPARLRTKLREAVAAPSWSHSTAFCKDTVATGGTVPKPRPMIVSSTSMGINPERPPTKPNATVPDNAKNTPIIGITL